MGFHKQRAEQEIKRAVSRIITYEVEDPNISNVTVMDVKMSVDMRYADIFVSVLKDSPEERQEVVKHLEKANKFIRTRLAQKVKLRFAPELRFKLDETYQRGQRIENILKELKEEEISE